MKTADIIQEIKEADLKVLPELIKQFESDERIGVIKALESAKKRILAFEKEVLRTQAMKEYELKYEKYRYICGIDEVGRGPLSGPVVAAAVILPKDNDILYLNDSKQLSASKRAVLFDEIFEKAVAIGIGIVSEKRIDEINVLQANYEAMRIAIGNLSVEPDLLLNDAVTIPEVDVKQVPIIKGDTKSISIAAASIVAKVTRDKIMEDYDVIYPEYEFASNKGYGSANHIAAIKRFGPCEIHRRTFIKNFL